MTVTYTTDGGLVGVSFLSAAEGGSGGLDGGFGGGGGLPSFGRTLLAELTSSLILDEGTGGPTWSRATKAWGFNELGYLEELASGCAFFGGARLVRNLLRYTEDLSNAYWSKLNCTTSAPDAFGLSLIDVPSVAAAFVYKASIPTLANRDVRYVVDLKKGTSIDPVLRIMDSTLSVSLGRLTINWSTATPVVSSIAGDVRNVTFTEKGGGIFSVSFTTNSSIYTSIACLVYASTSDSAKNLYAGKMQLVDVTNYNASYVPEYVSVGVEASPYFGAGIDGAKYFETDWQGAPIAAANLLGFRREAAATNNLLRNRLFHPTFSDRSIVGERWVCVQTVGSELISNGDFTSDTVWTKGTGWSIAAGVATGAAVNDHQLAQNLGAAITSGKTYTLVYTQTRTGGILTPSLGSTALNCGEPRSSSGTFTATLVCGANTTLYFYPGSTFSGTVDNVSLKECAIQIGTTTGLDGIANTATTLTATAADAIILQPITLASAARCASAYVKRRTGTGTISFTQDGTNWTDITAQINSSTWSRVQITSTLANPSVGFKISTSGDAIDVDCVQNEAGAVATSPIVTTTTTVTRNIDMLSYQSASNIDFTVGTCFARFGSPASTYVGYPVSCGNSGRILYGDATPAIRVYDGTTVINKPTADFLNGGFVKAASSWNSGNSTQKLSVDGSAVVSGAFDGSMGSGAVINIASETSNAQPVYVGPVAIYNYQMTDAEQQAITT